MIRFLTLMIGAVLLASGSAPAAGCTGPNPAITSAVVKNVTTSGALNTYHIVGTVTNLGSQAQASSTLQFVDIYVDRQKRNERGIPPLAPGQSYTFNFDWSRSTDAGNGSTTVHFQIRMVSGADCNPANGTNSVTF